LGFFLNIIIDKSNMKRIQIIIIKKK